MRTLRTQIMNVIAEQLDELFEDWFDEKWIAVTFSGKIVRIEDDPVTLLKDLDKQIRDELVFIHQVGGDRH